METADEDPSKSQLPDEGVERLLAHRLMVVWLFFVTVLLCIVLGGLLYLSDPTVFNTTGRTPILLVVVLAGALGGFTSCLRRLYKFEDIFPQRAYVALFKSLNVYLIAYASIPPIIGAVAAAVVYVVFAGEMIQGPLFPQFCCAPEGIGCHTLANVMGYWRPIDGPEYAKAVVWGFVSGFSERFFVDILDQFGSKAAESKAA